MVTRACAVVADTVEPRGLIGAGFQAFDVVFYLFNVGVTVVDDAQCVRVKNLV